MILYKLTDADGTTWNNTEWEIGKTVTVKNRGKPELCTDTVLHAYTSPLLAVLMNPAHGNFHNPLCFRVTGKVVVSDGTKVGCRRLTVVESITLPGIATTQKVAFGILCSLKIYKDKGFTDWADKWLKGVDRSYAAAYAAADAAASAAADAAADAAARAAADAAADAAARAAAYAAAYAANGVVSINFQELAEQAMQIK